MRRKTFRSLRSTRKKHREKSRKILILSFLFAVAAGGIIYGLSRTEFRIIRVEVSGARRVSEEKIQESVRQRMFGTTFGFIPKSHTLFLPKAVLRESLMKEFPVFSNVAISLQSLSALRVVVREREPKALWCTAYRDCFLIDETGFVFTRAETGTEKMYYRLLNEATTSPLGTEAIERGKLDELLDFLKELEKGSLYPEEALLKGQEGVEVSLRGGTRLILREGEYDLVLLKLETLMGEDGLLVRKDGTLSAAYIDFRYGNKIYYKPR